MSANQQRLEELRHNREKARLGGCLKKQEAIRMTGRGTARDRISMLLDDESFIEILEKEEFIIDFRDRLHCDVYSNKNNKVIERIKSQEGNNIVAHKRLIGELYE